MGAEGRGPGGKVGPPPCAHGSWSAANEPEPPASPPEADPAPDVDEEPVYSCDLCGARMLERHCKLVCPACGYQRDCSDP